MRRDLTRRRLLPHAAPRCTRPASTPPRAQDHKRPPSAPHVRLSRPASAGLCYHDVMVDSPAYKTAIARLPEEMQEARLRRIRRAVDLNVKKIVLPESQWVDPWREFDTVQNLLEYTQRELDEKAELDGEAWFANGGDITWFEYDVDETWFWRGIPDRKPATPKLER